MLYLLFYTLLCSAPLLIAYLNLLIRSQLQRIKSESIFFLFL